ncbi:hypothetical protein L1987_37570 [Smallanthus sonchifolius]|uniref:Uncharacterized protein n=1 Tax=Smallanthus sonchifolius TaxID=185202 RepID=A0ACB9HGQ1_9ASTR|nr:hypothetical protein L1987_37570 [Smallanthus sonchifolius]
MLIPSVSPSVGKGHNIYIASSIPSGDTRGTRISSTPVRGQRDRAFGGVTYITITRWVWWAFSGPCYGRHSALTHITLGIGIVGGESLQRIAQCILKPYSDSVGRTTTFLLPVTHIHEIVTLLEVAFHVHVCFMYMIPSAIRWIELSYCVSTRVNTRIERSLTTHPDMSPSWSTCG